MILADGAEDIAITGGGVIDGNKVIIYDRRLSDLVGYSGAFGILAHEVAHHYCRHQFDVSKNNWQAELEADRFAGAAAKRMKRSLEDALAMAVVLDERPSTSHPPADLRRAQDRFGLRQTTPHHVTFVAFFLPLESSARVLLTLKLAAG